MSIFNKEEEIQEVETIIGPSVNVEGDFVAQGNVVVEGSVSGNLKTNKHLKVGNNAKITANVSAGSASISGEIHGNLSVQGTLELAPSAKIFGDITTKTMQVASGATISGKVSAGEHSAIKSEEKNPKPSKTREWKMLNDEAKSRL